MGWEGEGSPVWPAGGRRGREEGRGTRDEERGTSREGAQNYGRESKGGVHRSVGQGHQVVEG